MIQENIVTLALKKICAETFIRFYKIGERERERERQRQRDRERGGGGETERDGEEEGGGVRSG